VTQDEEHLRLLSIFHYIVACLAALFSLFPLLYSAFGWFMLYAAAHPQQIKGEPPPAIMAWIFIVFGCFLFYAVRLWPHALFLLADLLRVAVATGSRLVLLAWSVSFSYSAPFLVFSPLSYFRAVQ
jgi:hypothetical protein